MTRYLFFALLLFSLAPCAFCGVASANEIELFKAESETVYSKNGATSVDLDITEVSSPFLIGSDEVIVGLAHVKMATSGKSGIIARFSKIEDGWTEKIAVNTNWRSHIILESGKKVDLAFATYIKDETIYILSAQRPEPNPENELWNFILHHCVTSRSVRGQLGAMCYSRSVDGADAIISEHLQNVKLIDGVAFMTRRVKPVFILRGKHDIDNKYVFVFAELNLISNSLTFNVKKADDEECDSSFFLVMNNIYMLPKGDGCKNKNMQFSRNAGKSWAESTGSITTIINTMTGKKDFTILARIDERKVLLVTEIKANDQDPLKHDVVLHVVDDVNIKNVGAFVTGATSISNLSLVYAGNELLSLSQETRDGDTKVILRNLKDTLEKIKKVVQEWNKEDEVKQQLLLEQEKNRPKKHNNELVPLSPSPDQSSPDQSLPHQSSPDQSLPHQSSPDQSLPHQSSQHQSSQHQSLPHQSSQHQSSQHQSSQHQSSPHQLGEPGAGNDVQKTQPVTNNETLDGANNSVRERVSVAVVLLCVLFGMWALIAF